MAISSSPALAVDGTVYFGCYDGGLYALSSSGAMRWKYSTGDEIRASSPAVAANGAIYIGSYDGYIHAVNPDGRGRRVYATGAYIRSSPTIDDGYLFVGSGDGRLYLANIASSLADSPWPMFRQNPRHTGRRPGAGSPVIAGTSPHRQVAVGGSVRLATEARGADTLAFQWSLNGSAVEGATRSTLSVTATGPEAAGLYAVTATNSLGSASGSPLIVGMNSTAKLVGAGTEYPDILHPNGNIFDQIQLAGAAAAVTADPGQVLRVSFVDPNNDIVQVEFSGAGTLALVLADVSGPDLPVLYNQNTRYVKGRAGIVLTGADASTNLSVFSVGRANAVNQALFKPDTPYDGIADIAFIAVTSRDGKFGGLRAANAAFGAAKGVTEYMPPASSSAARFSLVTLPPRPRRSPCFCSAPPATSGSPAAIWSSRINAQFRWGASRGFSL